MRLITRTSLIVVIVVALLISCEAKKKKKNSKQMILRQKETNPVDFIRLAVMRLIYGIATRVGLGEQISDALNGVFVPPGVDAEYDYDGGVGQDNDDDYDFDL
ncbi:unnamed protein product [Phaedon cochleariae]|uniref:Uncharacterized protein n=1 Tax=Phaedon cochleariae TaxID=80249 RepID=A0A9N9SAY4_PHACE|nr:unnamed protein product [Phaedon cochleariae]